ncbi:MAG: IS3 family transposase [Chloroflexota bacterium]
MKMLDEQFTKTPFYGVRKMTVLLNVKGYKVNEKRVRRLMRLMGLEAIYPKKKLSKAVPEHKKYPLQRYFQGLLSQTKKGGIAL